MFNRCRLDGLQFIWGQHYRVEKMYYVAMLMASWLLTETFLNCISRCLPMVTLSSYCKQLF